MKLKGYILFLLLINCKQLLAQNGIEDSLLTIINSKKDDTLEVLTYNSLFLLYEFDDTAKAKLYLDKAYTLSVKIKYLKGLGLTNMSYGYFAEDKGNYPKALNYYKKALNYYKKINNREGIADAQMTIGIVHEILGNYQKSMDQYSSSLRIYKNCKNEVGIANANSNMASLLIEQGNYGEALNFLFEALKSFEKIKNKSKIAAAYTNIGVVFKKQGNYSEAKKYYNLALKLEKKQKNILAVANLNSNIGIIHCKEGKFAMALKNYDIALKIFESIADNSGMAITYTNLGVLYTSLYSIELDPKLKKEYFEKSLTNHHNSIKLKILIGDLPGLANSYGSIGNTFMSAKKYKDAKKYFLKSNELSSKMGIKEYQRNSYKQLSILDSLDGDFKGAFLNHRLTILYSDSINNDENRKKTIQAQLTYSFEKKAAIAKAEQKEELANQELLANEKYRKQILIISFVIGGLALVFVFALFIFRSLKTTRKQKDVIELQKQLVEEQKLLVEHQKEIVEEKQKEVMDSIRYAKRIQMALLPSEKYIQKNLKSHTN